MSEAVSVGAIVSDVAAEIFEEPYEYFENIAYENIRTFEKYYLAVIVVIGVPMNILALLILIRCRLWLRNEGYLYIATVLIVNAVELAVYSADISLGQFDGVLKRLSVSSDIVCKILSWACFMIVYSYWSYVLLLLNVYFRQILITTNIRRECYTNFAARFCTLFGTKVVIGSLLIVCALTHFWAFSIVGLHSYGDTAHCVSLGHYAELHMLLIHVVWWMEFISLVIVLSLLLLVIWKKKKSSHFVFTQMNGASENNGDVDVIARIVVCCSAVRLVLRIPVVMHFLAFLSGYHHMYAVMSVLFLIAMANPLSTPIICFAVKSGFRDELKTIVANCFRRCCPGAASHRTLSPEPATDRNSVLQMDHIEDHSLVLRRVEDTEPIQHSL